MKRYDFYVVGKFRGHTTKCLIELLGSNEERAIKRWNELKAMTVEEIAQIAHDNSFVGELELVKKESKNCWWNDPTMVR